jgi:hypothetical protein
VDRIPPGTANRILQKEVLVGVLNGSVWGIIVGVLAVAFYADVPLAVVMTSAVVLNLVVAALAGVAIPLALHATGRDPALWIERAADVRHRRHGVLPVPGTGHSVSAVEQDRSLRLLPPSEARRSPRRA